MTQETKANQGKGAIFDLDGTLLDLSLIHI